MENRIYCGLEGRKKKLSHIMRLRQFVKVYVKVLPTHCFRRRTELKSKLFSPVMKFVWLKLYSKTLYNISMSSKSVYVMLERGFKGHFSLSTIIFFSLHFPLSIIPLPNSWSSRCKSIFYQIAPSHVLPDCHPFLLLPGNTVFLALI